MRYRGQFFQLEFGFPIRCLFSLVLLLFATVSSFAVDSTYIEYYRLSNEAEWHYDKGDLNQSEEFLNQAFSLVDKIDTKDLWIYCSILNKTNREKDARKFLKKFLKEQGLYCNEELFNKMLSKFSFTVDPKKDAKLVHLLQNPVDVLGEATCIICRTIDSMHRLDQKFRVAWDNHLDSVYYFVGDDSMWTDVRTACIKVDSVNSILLKQMIIDKQLNNAGHYCSPNLYHLLLHMDDDLFFEVKDELFLYVKSGQLSPWEFACVYDRHLITSDSCLKFFAYPITDNLDCISYDKILENRESIGLSSHYSRPSWGFYIAKATMMKFDLEEYYKKKISSY